MTLPHAEACLKSLQRATRSFRVVRGGPLAVCHDPALDTLEVALFCLDCQRQVEAVERQFGLRLRPWWAVWSHLRVYLFQSAAEVSEVYGGAAGGFASWDHWHIAVNLDANWGELVRHEVAHILGGRWNPRPMPLLCEGLAVWAQRSVNSVPIDSCAQRLVQGVEPTMACLLGSDPPLGTWERQRSYILAGSLTRALIQQFGFRKYQRLYGDKTVGLTNLTNKFISHFGIPLRSFVRLWLTSLSTRPPTSLVDRSSALPPNNGRSP